MKIKISVNSNDDEEKDEKPRIHWIASNFVDVKVCDMMKNR